MTPEEQIKLLEQKNKALSDQLDKVTADLFDMQDKAKALQNALDEKKHTEQLAGWAIDRALETAKIGEPTVVLDAASITSMAQHFCEWIKESSAQPQVVK